MAVIPLPKKKSPKRGRPATAMARGFDLKTPQGRRAYARKYRQENPMRMRAYRRAYSAQKNRLRNLRALANRGCWPNKIRLMVAQVNSEATGQKRIAEPWAKKLWVLAQCLSQRRYWTMGRTCRLPIKRTSWATRLSACNRQLNRVRCGASLPPWDAKLHSLAKSFSSRKAFLRGRGLVHEGYGVASGA